MYDRFGLILHRSLIYQLPVLLSVNQQRSIKDQELYIILEEKHVAQLTIIFLSLGCLPEMTI